jgi:hypothetical protein
MPPLPGSPVIAAGSTALIPGGITIDQRGEPRIFNSSVDIGSVETQGYTLTPAPGDTPQTTFVGTAFASPLTVLVTPNYANDPVNGGIIKFTAPTSGASATLSASSVFIGGGRVAVTATANSVVGSYIASGDAGGASGRAAFSLKNVATSSGLAVSTIVPTSTGFIATFDEPFVLSQLNLYGTATGGQGPADVTLVGASTGPVTGSLIVDPTDRIITFIQTGKILAPDTYTVTLRSATNGFGDAGGNLLQGNNGTAGVNYTASFTVASSTARVLSIPDFARGPGQPVVIPAATGTGLPLTISDGTNVTSINLTLTYNPTLLTITGANLGSSAPAGSSVSINTSTPGVALLTFTSPTALAAGLDTYAILVASVPNGAPYASKEDLVLGNLSINGGAIAAIDQDGVHVVGYLGDTTGNGGYSGLDASLIARVVANIDTGFAAFPLLDPTIMADIAGRGSLTAQDASFVAQFVANIPQPRIPALPGITITKGGPDPEIWLPRDIDAAPGSSLIVPVLFRQTNGSPIGLDSADIAIEFDPSLFMVTGVTLGDVPQGFTLAVSYDNATGEIIATERSTSGPIELAPGTLGSLLLIDLTIRPGAALGIARLNLLAEGRVGSTVLYTSLDDGGLTLNPAPTDSDLDPTDGIVTVTTSTTPQPQPTTPTSSVPSGATPNTTPVPVPVVNTIAVAPRAVTPVLAPAPIVIAPVEGSTIAPAGPPAAIDLAIEATLGESSSVGRPAALGFLAVVESGDSTATGWIPWTAPDPSIDFPAPDSSVSVPARKARNGRVLLAREVPDGMGFRP